jgi:CheY-like chemotaxis protein
MGRRSRFNQRVPNREDTGQEPYARAQLRNFQELMQHRVQRILLVSSLYDSFILSEEGQLQETLLSQFIDLNLTNVPDLTRVPSGAEALERIRLQGNVDLVVCGVKSGKVDAVELSRQLRDLGLFVPVVVLAYSNRDLTDFIARHDTSLLSSVFLWQGDARILLAMVKCIEDRLNVAHDTGMLGVPAIIVVEDNVKFYSSFLPVIYSEIFSHMQRLMSEDLNLTQKMLRMRARPKVLLCQTYEEAWSYFTCYEEQILGVISDIEFPRNGKTDPHAGLELTTRVHQARSDVRIVLQSSFPENRKLADKIGAAFLLKGSPMLLHQLRRTLVQRFGFGDFVFRLPDLSEVDRAQDLKSMIEKLRTIPSDSIAYHAERNHFSNWLKARTEFVLAEKLRPRKLEDFDDVEHMRADLLHMIGEYREERYRSVVADFDRKHYEPATSITRIGDGSLGGKARGIAFANRILQRSNIAKLYPEMDIFVPTSVVVATGVFDEFLEQGGLDDFAMDSGSDREITKRFLAEPFPDYAVDDLRAFLEHIDYPLAVRSSSLLEDSLAQPFAGIYNTYMLPNNHPDPGVRLRQLIDAVKWVYASTFLAQAKSYVNMTPYRLEEEKMAVLIQRIVGTRRGKRFYPDFAGVARSYNFYPQEPYQCEDGLVAIALGMGRTVVDGDPCIRFSPRYPRHVLSLSSVKNALENSQRGFYALDLALQPTGEHLPELERYGLEVAEEDDSLRWVGSTYLPEDDRVVDGISRPGVRLVTFSQVLKHGAFPLAEVLDTLLDYCARGTREPVEIEFAGNLHMAEERRAEFGFLQLRPLALSTESEEVEIGDVPDEALICRSSQVLGNGRFDEIRDLVVVDFHRFERQHSVEVAHVVGSYNAILQKEGCSYLLIGVGRWGSADQNLGIPVGWTQIAAARVIVEACFRDFQVTPSQGTHFFQNLSSSNVGYFTVRPDASNGFVAWDWLASQPAVRESGCVRHIRLPGPAIVKMSGRTGNGVILKPASMR